MKKARVLALAIALEHTRTAQTLDAIRPACTHTHTLDMVHGEEVIVKGALATGTLGAGSLGARD